MELKIRLFIVDETNRTMEKILTKLTDFIAAQIAHNTAVSDDLDALQTAARDNSTQISSLKAALLSAAAPAELDADTLAAIDAATLSSQALEDKANALAGKTPPTVPPALEVVPDAAPAEVVPVEGQ